MRALNTTLQMVGLTVSAALLVGCGSAEDKAYAAGVNAISTHRSAHPHYPLMAFDDFGSDNGPVGIPVDVYSFYCHATTKPNPAANVSTVDASSRRLATTFEKAIQSLVELEASNPAPHAPYPTNPDWKQAPHPAPGTYEIVIKNGLKVQTFRVQFPVRSGESAATELAKLRPELLADATQALKEHAQLEQTEMKSFKPPPGFTLATQEMLDVQQGSRGVEPHLIGDPLCLVPIDKQLAMSAFDHSIKKLLSSTAHLNPKPYVAHLLIKGPGLDGAYAIPLAAGQAQDHAVADVESILGNRLDDLNRTTS